MRTINEKFTDEEHHILTENKEKTREKLGKERLTWHDYLLLKATEDTA